jgi:phosphoenolpyruvate---glycerone phosphotransferase subunit DhaL
MNRMGGSSGALFGTLFLRAAMSVKDQDSLSVEQFAAMWQAGTQAVMARGKAQPGDKTMVDALVPAAESLSQAVADGKPLLAALEDAAHAAAQGAESTASLQAKHGRARYVGERAVGHVDAGARSAALIFEAMHTYWEENHDGEA